MMKPKTKLLFRHRSMEMGGVEKVMLSLLNNLNKDKFDMTVLLNLNQGELRDEFPPHVKKICIAKGKEDMAANALLQKIALLRRRMVLKKYAAHREKQDAKLLNHEKFDVEIAMDWRDFESVLSSPDRDSKKIGWFHSEINVPKLQPLVPDILKHFPRFDHMVYCSEKIKNLMHQHYPNLKYPPESVIINAIPIKEIKEKAEEDIQDFPENRPVFISIGRLHTRKGYHKLMDAHAKLLQDGFPHTVLILGDGEELVNLQEQQKKFGVEKSFILAGNRMNPYPYIKKSDFFIMPSESEAWPLVIAEALILQKPTIATDTGDVSAMIDDRKTGYLINYDTAEIYGAMKKFLTEPDLVAQIRENLKGSEQKFDNEKIFKAIEEIFDSLLKN